MTFFARQFGRRTIALPLAAALLLGPTAAVFAAQLPHPGSNLFIQTSGPGAGLNIGDYHTSPAGGNTDHRFIVRVPSNWPAGELVTVSLYDPELAGPDPSSPAARDEVRGGADSASFTLAAPAGAVIAAATYADASTNGAWAHLATFDPGTHGTGTYELRVTVSDNDDNSWRLDASYDPDCVVGGPGTCTGVVDGDESDTAPSGSSRIGLAVLRTSYQHGTGGSQCQDHVFYVSSATPRPLRAHNFDMDNSGSVTYTDPNGVDHAGTVSANGRWNNSPDANRVGDVLADVSGWWNAQVCISSNNQYVFEAPGASPTFAEPQPEPRLTITKSDGVETAVVGDSLTYDVVVTNVSDTDPLPDEAFNVVVTDTLPAGLVFVSCSGAGFTCTEAAGVVTAELNDELAPAGSATISIETEIDPNATPTVTNEATVSYEDRLGFALPHETASDSVDIDFMPEIRVVPTGPSAVLRGDLIVTTFVVSHAEASDLSPVYSPEFSCVACDTVGYVDGDANSNGVLDAGEAWTYETSVSTDGSTPDPLSVVGEASGLDGNDEAVDATAEHVVDIVEPGTVTGNVFEDLNGNGFLDAGEPGIDDAELTLSDGVGTLGTTLPTDGGYVFDHLFPGVYAVTIDESALPIGLSNTAAPLPATLAEGGAVTGLDFGYAYPATIAGSVFEDGDFSGSLDAAELGLQSIEVTLFDGNGHPMATTMTDALGNFSFMTMPGNVSVGVTGGMPDGWAFTTDDVLSLGLITSGSSVAAAPIGLANRPPEILESSQTIDRGTPPDRIPAADPEGEDVTFRLSAGELPLGLTLEADGTFSGDATTTGVYNLQLELCDTGDPTACATYDWQLNVVEPPPSVQGVDSLPFTGAESGPLAATAILLLAAGAGVVWTAQRAD